MSYTGYDIYLCVNGHYNAYNAFDGAPVECEDCGAAMAWCYSVDQTNDDGVEPALVEHKPIEVVRCAACGHGKTVTEQQFEIPENTGRLLVHQESLNVPLGLVQFRDNDSNKVFATKDEARTNSLNGWFGGNT